MDKSPATVTRAATSKNTPVKSSRAPLKRERCALHILGAGMDGVSKLTALPDYGETSLPTTISELGMRDGFNLEREMRPHTHRMGGLTHFTWYWLPDRKEAEKALALINRLREQRGCPLIPPVQAKQLLSQFPEERGAYDH